MFLEENNVYFGTGSDTPNVVDAETGERRKAVIQDIANNAKVVDYLDDISFIMCMGIASDVKDTDLGPLSFRSHGELIRRSPSFLRPGASRT